jgi:hypothetical protein
MNKPVDSIIIKKNNALLVQIDVYAQNLLAYKAHNKIFSYKRIVHCIASKLKKNISCSSNIIIFIIVAMITA